MEQIARQVLAVRLSSMGDVIHTLPAVAALRKALPEAKIDWAIEERWAELLCAKGSELDSPRSEQKPLIDRVLFMRTQQWRKNLLTPSTWGDLRRSLGALRQANYDTAIDFQGAIRSAAIARWSGAHSVVGFAKPRETPARWLYTKTVRTEAVHVIEQNLALAAELTRSTQTSQAILPRDEAAEAWCDHYFAEHKVNRLILINPGAGWGAKQWPAERYGLAARELSQDGHTVRVNYGPGEEPLARIVETSSGGSARPVQCSLGQLIALTRRASLFLGGDTGPLHLAAALKVPVVALFGPTDPARNGPYATRSLVLRSTESVTSHTRRTETEPGLLRITVEVAVQAARQLLQGAAA